MDHRSMFTDQPAAPAATDTEQALIELWQDALQVAPLGRDDNFFELGGTSMLAVRICAGVERTLGVRPDTAAVFDTDTLADFADHIRALAEARQLVEAA